MRLSLKNIGHALSKSIPPVKSPYQKTITAGLLGSTAFAPFLPFMNAWPE
jgi:hypothetical protein